MRHVEDFVRLELIYLQLNFQLFSFFLSFIFTFNRTLMASEELMQFDQVRVFLDEDFTCTEKFTVSFTQKHKFDFQIELF